MKKLFAYILVFTLPLIMSGCVIRHLQPAQYGTELVQQVKVLGTKIVVPSTPASAGAQTSLLELYLGYVSETVLVIPVVSNVDTNGVVSTNKPILTAAPLSTTFGVSDSASSPGVKISDSVISGYESLNNVPSNLSSLKASITKTNQSK